MTAKELLAKSMEEYLEDSNLKWPQNDFEEIDDAIEFESEVARVIENYEYSVNQVFYILEIVYKEYYDKPDVTELRNHFNKFIYMELPYILARYLIKENYPESYATKILTQFSSAYSTYE